MTPLVELVDICKTFDGAGEQPVAALKQVSLAVDPGEFVSIVGPSGCGKSTLLDIIAGLVAPTSGQLNLSQRVSPKRVVGYMMQDDCLLPWRTVLKNVLLGLEVEGRLTEPTRIEVQGLLSRFGLTGFEHMYPSSLSGGMKQRAALMRTMLLEREVILLDEPFARLDAITRFELQAWLADIWRQFGKAILLVTHDIEEAVFLSDRVYVLSPRPGRVIAIVDILLPRPRERAAIVTDPEFSRLKRRILDLVRASLQDQGIP